MVNRHIFIKPPYLGVPDWDTWPRRSSFLGGNSIISTRKWLLAVHDYCEGYLILITLDVDDSPHRIDSFYPYTRG